MYTPADVHYGRTAELAQVRAGVLADAYAAHPDRFVTGRPYPKPVPTKLWINPPEQEVPRAQTQRPGVSIGLTGSVARPDRPRHGTRYALRQVFLKAALGGPSSGRAGPALVRPRTCARPVAGRISADTLIAGRATTRLLQGP